MHRESFNSLVCLCLPIITVSVGGTMQLIVQILTIDATLMGYWILGQVRTMMRSLIYKSNLSMGENILGRVLMMPFAVLLRSHLRSDRIIAILGSFRGRVVGLGDAL